jgi:hypothetical protein
MIFSEQVLEEGLVDNSIKDYESWVKENGSNTMETDWCCAGCGCRDITCLEEAGAFIVCINCGRCQNKRSILSEVYAPTAVCASARISTIPPVKKNADGTLLRPIYGSGLRRRYRREFYYRERISQWMCVEPKIPDGVMDAFENAVESGDYGWRGYVTRGTVMQMCKDMKLCKYKENWKSILSNLNPPAYEQSYELGPEQMEYMTDTFSRISKMFDSLDKKAVSKFLKGSKGKDRHHILHVNYVHRKILESMGEYRFHHEFPLLRTPAKIHALDDVMQIICRELNMTFTRTAVVVPPKCRSRFKKIKKI